MVMPKAKTGLRPSLFLTRTAGGTAAWTVGTVIPWDTASVASAGSPDIVATIAGGTIGQITLRPGTYLLECGLGSIGSGTLFAQTEEWQWYDVTHATYLGVKGRGAHVTAAGWGTQGLNLRAFAILTVTTITVVRVEITLATGTGSGPQDMNLTECYASVERLS